MEANGVNRMQITDILIVNPVFDWGDNREIVYFHNRGFSTITYYGVEKKFIREVLFLDTDVAWSKANPDRKQNFIAYLSDKKNGPNIWVMSHDGKTVKQITKKGGFSPFWFPDGKTLLYVEQNDVYKIDVKNKEKTRLTYYFRSFFPLLADVKVSKAAIE